MEVYVYSAGVTMLTSLLLMILAFRVGMARGNGGVQSYETYSTTDKTFTTALRIQMNTLENTMAFLPLLWVATVFSGQPMVAAGIGAVWLALRVAYAWIYTVNPKKRFMAFAPSLLCLVALVLLSVYGLMF